MQRSRGKILSSAADLVASGGLAAVTMSSVARRAAVAKATVYNHFRDRDELLQALMVAEGERLLAHCDSVTGGDRIDAAAEWLSGSAVLSGLRQYDPATVLGLAGWATTAPRAYETVASWCAPSAGDAGTEDAGTEHRDTAEALRWLVSFIVAPRR